MLFLIIGIIIVTSVLYFIWLRLRYINTSIKPNNENIIILTRENYNRTLKNKIVLVDYWAEWCVPCRMMAPILNELAFELPENATIAKLNVDHFQDIAAKSNIKSIPTLILFKNEKEVKRFVGVKTKSILLKEINNIK